MQHRSVTCQLISCCHCLPAIHVYRTLCSRITSIIHRDSLMSRHFIVTIKIELLNYLCECASGGAGIVITVRLSVCLSLSVKVKVRTLVIAPLM